ncbi:MAG: L-lysine 2,3-aminomutase [Candidatus Anoxychlamydiales bacterium]|nr:L-lysine 2,3-aminomutase [Candidatus Anoxychlamydiales bacterium]NGX35911.1 L-lysine 2,3-aminomutase [Candidatus Anoxychlamydiales bacterium]
MLQSFTDINKLIKFLKLDNKNKKKILLKSSFSLYLPIRLAKKIKKNDLTDPILRQFVPLIAEEKEKIGFSIDPLEEKSFKKGNLLKKYKNRALLITTNACHMHCRYCFRKHNFEKMGDKNFIQEIKLINEDKSLDEIILSGGDPLSLSHQDLLSLLTKLDNIPHLKRIRLHTRSIIAQPEKIISSEFLKIFKNLKKQIIFVFHINHPKEIDKDVKKAINSLKKQNFLLFNQSVLLKGINDDFKTLKTLFEILIDIGIIPYYLHQLDKIKGTSHFDVSTKKGTRLMKDLNENMSGYMIPKYVQEIPNKKCKSLI